MGEKNRAEEGFGMARDTRLAVILFWLIIMLRLVSFCFQFDGKLLESRNHVLKSFIFSFLPQRMLSNNRHHSKY